MRDFKRTGVRVALFAGLTALMLAVLSFIMNPLRGLTAGEPPRAEKNPVSVMRQPPETLDYLVYGDSLSYASVNPLQIFRDTGAAGYVCGGQGQDIFDIYWSLRQVLRRQSPRLVAIETHALNNSGGLGRSANRLVGSAAAAVFPVFRFHNMWRNALEPPEADIPYYKGFQLRPEITPYKGGDYRHFPGEDPGLDPVDLLLLRRIAALCEKNGARVVLFSVISPANYPESSTAAYAALAKKAGVEYWDMNPLWDEGLLDPAKDFFDGGDHVNYAGSKKLTAALAEQFPRWAPLPDRRGEPGFEAWEAACGEFTLAADGTNAED